ncbi:hypothetical protein GCM10027277_17160 [Pseudoduganella ginsengisoli]|uniref:Uncharacterized protein n=1 Tax=Pseudoduganella ginsengisoli TaxID=1462440 RepID=A0A6L6PWI9_9BURK|nr:hypothetical protein [Pseudoduganella ginsengisoli]MTW01022.1 hypothetical protein [Pseudoduganella ginsengisoli]
MRLIQEHRLSFTPAPAPQGGWRLALMALGIVALLPAGAHWLRVHGEVQALQARIAAVQPRRAAPAALPPAMQKEQEQQVKVVAEAIRQLNLPVPRLLKTLQAPADMHVALLGVDLNGQPSQDNTEPAAAKAAPAPHGPAGSLKIAAEAETAQDMLNYLAFLSQQPLFRSVYLVKHEMAGNGEARPYRFQLEAQWRQ